MLLYHYGCHAGGGVMVSPFVTVSRRVDCESVTLSTTGFAIKAINKKKLITAATQINSDECFDILHPPT